MYYDPAGTAPPEIIATGSGMIAEEIVDAAREHGIPLHRIRDWSKRSPNSTSAP